MDFWVVTEVEANMVRAQLAVSNTRVAGRVFNIPTSFEAFILPIFR